MTDREHEDGALSVAEQIKDLKGELRALNAKFDRILDQFAGLPLRVRALEVVVYGGCGVVLLGVLATLTTLVIKAP